MSKIESVTASKPVGITLPDRRERIVSKEVLMGTALSGLKKW